VVGPDSVDDAKGVNPIHFHKVKIVNLHSWAYMCILLFGKYIYVFNVILFLNVLAYKCEFI
jgi:hypothetical protein